MTRDIDSPEYRDSNVGEGMIPPRSATPKPRAGEHVLDHADEIAGSSHRLSRRELAVLLRRARAERDSLAAQNRELMNMLAWHVNHEGECLGDHPELLEVARALLAKHGR